MTHRLSSEESSFTYTSYANSRLDH